MNNFDKVIYIPKELTCFHTYLKDSAEQVALLKPIQSPAFLHESKFAGLPYLTNIMEHPKDVHNQYMLFLAQINFSELQLSNPFPKSGILQFYISQQCLEKVKHHYEHYHFKVQYLPHRENYSDAIQDFTYLKEVNLEQFPIKHEMKLQAKTQYEPVSAMDYRLENYFNPEIMSASITLDERSFQDVYLESYLAADHKIGGYPYFINEDFRKNSKFLQHYDTLLLQIVSNDAHQIMWGDSGIMSFFINSKMLEQLDFSDIYLHLEEY
ncbi:YwqG family protein [Solibacillus sp. FSL R7-0682]|uniref:YwqG family protein n=1 Tax=Solibacillus sp. FSL R7-0682 TaxID=2921690 RepID=UPI0030FA06D7